MVKRKIMIDARVLEENCNHGIARYVDEFIDNLVLEKDSIEFDFIILCAKKSRLLYKTFPANFKLYIAKTPWMSLWGQFELLWVMLKYRPHLFHAPSFMIPLFSFVPLFVTIHDTNHVVLAQNYSFKHKLYYDFFLKRRLQQALRIITVSYFSKREIERYMRVDENKISVIYNGVSPIFKPKSKFSQEQLNSVKQRLKLPESYMFAIGSNKPHKNLGRLIDAYCSGQFQNPLVILCRDTARLEEVANKYQDNKVIFLDQISDVDLPLVYALCDVFVYPSLYEGFGFPPVEAMACGVPVVVSHSTSMPEILGQSAFYFNPESIEDIQKVLYEVCNGDKALIEKNIVNGFQQIQKYSWQQMAKEILRLYAQKGL